MKRRPISAMIMSTTGDFQSIVLVVYPTGTYVYDIHMSCQWVNQLVYIINHGWGKFRSKATKRGEAVVLIKKFARTCKKTSGGTMC